MGTTGCSPGNWAGAAAFEEWKNWERAVRLQGEQEAGEFADAPLRVLDSLLSGSAIVAV